MLFTWGILKTGGLKGSPTTKQKILFNDFYEMVVNDFYEMVVIKLFPVFFCYALSNLRKI